MFRLILIRQKAVEKSFTESTLPEEHPESQSQRALLRGHRSRSVLPTLGGGAPLQRALRSLVVRET